MIDFILNASLWILIAFLVVALWYCAALAVLLAKIHGSWWKGFIPIYNIKALVDALKLPKKWFYLSLTPYFGSVYVIAIMYRLGQLWGKHFAFTAFWLTVGAPVGFLTLAFSKKQPDFSVLDSPPPSLAMIKAKINKQK